MLLRAMVLFRPLTEAADVRPRGSCRDTNPVERFHRDTPARQLPNFPYSSQSWLPPNRRMRTLADDEPYEFTTA